MLRILFFPKIKRCLVKVENSLQLSTGRLFFFFSFFYYYLLQYSILILEGLLLPVILELKLQIKKVISTDTIFDIKKNHDLPENIVRDILRDLRKDLGRQGV